MKTSTTVVRRVTRLATILILLFIGGCQKELPKEVTLEPDLLADGNQFAGAGKTRVLMKGNNLRVNLESNDLGFHTSLKKTPELTGGEKITEILKSQEVKRKKNKENITTSDATFTATEVTGSYHCYGTINHTGISNWYLINTHTWTYTYVGTTGGGTIDFWVAKPSIPGSFRLWAEDPGINGEFTGYEFLGDPFVGVTVSGGMLVFDNATALNNLYTRLEAAYEDHQATLFDGYNSLTDAQMDAHAISEGYDEWQPLKEFEAFFGLTSLRQYYAGLVAAYNANGTSAACNPRIGFEVDDDIFAAMLNTSGQATVGEDVGEFGVLNESVCKPEVCSPASGCDDHGDKVRSDTLPGDIIVEKILRHRPSQTGGGIGLENVTVIKAKVKAKSIIYKITGAHSRRPWSTKMAQRVYGQSYDGHPNFSTPPCGTSLGGYDTGFNTARRRWQRKNTHRFDGHVWLPNCGIYGEYDLPTLQTTLYMNM